MSKREWFEAWMASRKGDLDINVHHKDSGIAWAGFWIGLGLVLAAQILVTHQVIFK